MKKTISGMLLTVVMISIPSTNEYIAPPMVIPVAEAGVLEKKTVWSETELFVIAEEKAMEFGVSKEKMIQVIKCEAPWTTVDGVKSYSLSNTQSKHRYNEGQIQRNPSWGAVGDYERSFGPVQIHEPAHPNITREEAVDPDFAIGYLASEMSAGRGKKWSCY